MLIPRFWAEARARHRERTRQITIRRFGWSDASQDEAQAMAEARANEALQRAIRGEILIRREASVAYSGVGLPIREEILETFGRNVVTRNSYGARCLNTPDVLFADVDAEQTSTPWLIVVTLALALATTVVFARGYSLKAALGVFLFAFTIFTLVGLAIERRIRNPEAPARAARARIARFVAAHPGWAVRIYRTPSGLRAMATHRLFAPDDPEVKAFFDAIDVDKVYAQMCANQQCFRARLTPKPWRIGMKHIKPRTTTWPVPTEKRPARDAWIAQYEAKSRGYAACRSLEAVGSGAVHIDVETVRRFHDVACRALDESLPIA